MQSPGFIAKTSAAVIGWLLARKLVRAFLLYSEKRGPLLADSVTYRALFSVFAGLLLGFSVAALWLSGNPAALDAIIDAVDAAIPGLVGDNGIVDPKDIAPAAFSLTGIVSLVALIGAALGAIGSLRVALRTIANTVDADVFWLWVTLRNLGLAIGIAVSFVLAAFLNFSGQLGVAWVTDVLGIPASGWTFRLVSIAVIFLLDVVVIAGVFRALSGVRASLRVVLPGALLGGLGLVVLQELSGLFVGGARSNPLLASFGSLLALLIWFNLSAQVVLIAAAYIVTGVEEERDRVGAKYGAQTFAQRRVQQAELTVAAATKALQDARDAERSERESARVSPS